MLEEYYAPTPDEEQEELAHLNEWVDSLNLEKVLLDIRQAFDKALASSMDVWYSSLMKSKDEEGKPLILKSSLTTLALGHCSEIESMARILYRYGLLDKDIYEDINAKMDKYQDDLSKRIEEWLPDEEEATQSEV